jgi:hypothetical protein
MFIQVIQGTVSDPAGLRQAVANWVDEISPQAIGWLGVTGGVTADGRGISVVRFNSVEDAQRNGGRPEQQAWWAEASKCFAGDVVFHDCTDTFTYLDGGSDQAGFVQVMQGRISDAGRARQMMEAASDQIRAARPDVIGGTVALHGDGGFTQVIYFTSEEAARAGEKADNPRESSTEAQEMASMFSDLVFFDLTEPQLYSAA